jgi:hypothetical protein
MRLDAQSGACVSLLLLAALAPAACTAPGGAARCEGEACRDGGGPGAAAEVRAARRGAASDARSGAGAARAASDAAVGGSKLPRRVDATFGTKGLVALQPGGIYPLDYRVGALLAQPGGTFVVAGSMGLDADDAYNANRPNHFAARFDEHGFDLSFGQQGAVTLNTRPALIPIDLPVRFGDETVVASQDPASGAVFLDGQFLHVNIEGDHGWGPMFWRVDADGSAFRYNNATGLLGGFVVIPSPAGCLAARRYPSIFGSPAPAGETGIEFAPCPDGDWSHPAFGPRLSLTGEGLSLWSLGEPESVGGAVPPMVGTDGSIYVVASSWGKVGALKLRHAGGLDVAPDASYGAGNGRSFVPIEAGTPFDALSGATLDAAGSVYLAGRAGPPGAKRPYLRKLRADGAGLDPSFGQGGVVEGAGVGATEWSCLLADGQGRLLGGGVRDGVPVLVRLTAAGVPDESFEPGGTLVLPFAPQRCALDEAGRLVVAGSRVGAYGVPAIAAVRVRLDAGARGPANGLGGDAQPACSPYDQQEPNGEPWQASWLINYNGLPRTTEVQAVMIKSVLDGPGDVDWLRYEGEFSLFREEIGPRAEVDAGGPADVCLYVEASQQRFQCHEPYTRDDESLPGFRGCCGVNVAEFFYDLPSSDPDGLLLPFFVRVARPDAPAGTCGVYHVTATL